VQLRADAKALNFTQSYTTCANRSEIDSDQTMLTASEPTLYFSSVLGELADAALFGTGPRLFYASRLIGALLAATLVPILIDRRFRR
jgi:hypothetical protein